MYKYISCVGRTHARRVPACLITYIPSSAAIRERAIALQRFNGTHIIRCIYRRNARTVHLMREAAVSSTSS